MTALAPAASELRARRLVSCVGVVGALTFFVGLFVDPSSAWAGYLAGFLLLSGVAVVGPFFRSIHELTGSRWSTPLLPIFDRTAALLPFVFVAGAGLVAGAHRIYPWALPHEAAADASAHGAAGHAFDAWWSIPFFAARLFLIVALWTYGARLVARSDAASVERRKKRAAFFVALFGATFSLAAFDWAGGLTPHWPSTAFALDLVSGAAQSGLAIVVLLVFAEQRGSGAGGRLDVDARNDLGKLLLALSMFWAYVAYCQYGLIWYANLPEETPRLLARAVGGFAELTLANVLLNGVLPFLVLIFRSARTSESTLTKVAWAILLGRALDLWLHAAPSIVPGRALPGPAAVGAYVAFAAVVALRLRERRAFQSA
jgi:hypothetical protein